MSDQSAPLATEAPADAPTPVSSVAPPRAHWWSKALDFYWTNYLPLMMIFSVLFGYIVPAPGKWLDKPKIDLCGDDEACEMGSMKVTSSICVMCIFILSGLGLKTDDVKTALVQWQAILYSFLSINFLTGCVAFIMVQLPFEPPELAMGLAVFCAMPTTLSSGAVLVGSADGNVTLSLLLTAGTNVLSIFTIPFLLKVYLSTNSTIVINAGPMLLKLLVTILAPLFLGKLLRQIEPLAAYRLRNKKWFGIASSTFLVTVPLMKVSSYQEAISDMPIGNLFLIILAAILLHLFYLVCNTLLTFPLGLKVKERKAVIILTSQKYVFHTNLRILQSKIKILPLKINDFGATRTLPVAVTVISFLDETLNLGIVIIPCIVCHLSQLVIDGMFVNSWSKMTDEGGFLGLGQVPIGNAKNVEEEADGLPAP